MNIKDNMADNDYNTDAPMLADREADPVAIDLAKNIGEQMSGKILCPRQCIEGQELYTYGDLEDKLFCPHCEIDIRITVSNL